MAGRPKGTPKTGGRRPGSRNKRSAKGPLFVERVKARLLREKRLTLEQLSVELLTCGIPAVIQKELQTLREYDMGKPIQPVEAAGTAGGPVRVEVLLVRPQQ